MTDQKPDLFGVVHVEDSDMAAMIAGMTTEYAIEHQIVPGGKWHQVTRWSHEPPLNDGHALAPDERIVCRYVTAPQPLGEEQ